MMFAQSLRTMHKEEKGFTLVELMVVVIIIGLLTAVAIPNFRGVMDNSRQKADMATGKSIKDALDRFYAAKGKYPTVIGELTSASSGQEVYLNSEPKAAQGGGALLSVVFDTGITAATVNGVIEVDKGTGQVQVHKVTSNVITPTVIWDSGS